MPGVFVSYLFNFLLNPRISQLRYFRGAKPGLKLKCPLKKQTNKNKSAKNTNPKEKDPCKDHGKMDSYGFNKSMTRARNYNASLKLS